MLQVERSGEEKYLFHLTLDYKQPFPPLNHLQSHEAAVFATLVRESGGAAGLFAEQVNQNPANQKFSFFLRP